MFENMRLKLTQALLEKSTDHLRLNLDQYAGHVTPSSGSAYDETMVIFEYILSQLKGGLDKVDVHRFKTT